MITIIAVGKKHEDWISRGIERYEKRLRPPFDIRWTLLPHSSLEGAAAQTEESKRLLDKIPEQAYVILLDEKGKQFNSPTFASMLTSLFTHSQSITIIIGGAYGVDGHVYKRANQVVSLSQLVFPHQLVRLILIEQMYRAQTIERGGTYHHIY